MHTPRVYSILIFFVCSSRPKYLEISSKNLVLKIFVQLVYKKNSNMLILS